MLEHLGHAEAARAIEDAIETVLADPAALTPDMGGGATTQASGCTDCRGGGVIPARPSGAEGTESASAFPVAAPAGRGWTDAHTDGMGARLSATR